MPKYLAKLLIKFVAKIETFDNILFFIENLWRYNVIKHNTKKYYDNNILFIIITSFLTLNIFIISLNYIYF